MPTNDPTISVPAFLGLYNNERPARLPIGALVEAQNIDIDDTGGIERRKGYGAITGLGNVTAAYATLDERRLFVVDAGILKRVLSLQPLVTLALAVNVPYTEVWWAENGDHVFCSGAINGVIYNDTFTPFAEWGSDAEQSFDAQGQTLQTDEADIGTLSPPTGTECVSFFEGCVWLSYFDSVANQSFVFRSKPFFWSRWDLAMDYFAVPGHVLLLAAPNNGGAMVVGTDQAIHVYSQGTLQQVADWGAVPGKHDEDEGRVYFWSEYGLCRAMPFEAMTDEAVTVPGGTRAVVGVFRPTNKHTRAVVLVADGQIELPPP